MQNKKILMIALLCFQTLIMSQNPWYQGNLKGINDLAFELNIKGVEDDVWQKRVNSYIKLMLLERGIEILDGLIPKMVIDINIIDSKVKEVSSFFIQLSIFGYTIPEEEYYKSFSESKIIKNLITTKIFSYEILGQTVSENLYKDIEKNINASMKFFLNQWYSDNPGKQF